MRKGQMSNAGWPIFKEHLEANFAVDTPDGVHQTSSFPDAMGPIDLGPYRAGPMMPATHTGATSAPSLIGNKSGKGKTVTVK